MVVVVILIFAASLRLFQLGRVPPGLYLDEVLYGLDAYSLIKTGKDIYGHVLPLAFQSSGYYPPLFTYLLAPLLLFFPLTDWVVRLPAALSGILTIIAIYFLAKKLFGRDIALLASFLLALLPWQIHLSRVAFLGSFGISFLVAGAYFFLRGDTLTSLTILALSTQVHYGYKFLAPALFLVLVLLYRRRLNLAAYLIIVVTAISHLIGIRYYNALFRVSELSRVNLPQIASQYLTAFSPQFLFLNGDHNLLLNPWGKGQLPLVFIPLLILGFWQLVKFASTARMFILSWLLLAPIPSALAGQGDHAVRNSPLIIPLTLLAALGLRRAPILAVFIIINSLTFWRFYTGSYPAIAASLWGQPERELVRQLDSTSAAIIPDKFYVKLSYYAFDSRLDPVQLQQAIVTRRVGNLYFADE